ncbi:MAG: L-threonylcarbamoyladenylate synthase [Candidatus Paceibacterota bacterium]
MKNSWQKAEEILNKDGVVVLPTDTLYGIIASALSKKAVEKLYKIKGRIENKPFIVLINSYKDLNKFGIKIDREHSVFLQKIWPGKVSVIFPCTLDKWHYVHRGVESIALRMISPKNKNLFNLINKVGPLVAPSANKEGDRAAEDILEAKKYFGNEVSLYINGGNRKFKSSTLVKFKNNSWVVLRQGEVIIK